MRLLKRRVVEPDDTATSDPEPSLKAPPVTPATERRPVSRPEPARRPRQSRRSLVLATIFAVGLVGAAVLWSWWASRDDSSGADAALPGATGVRTSTLLVVADGEGRAASLALSLDDGADTRSLFVIPPSLSIQLPGFGDGLLADASLIGGANLAELSLINELGISIDRTLLIPAADISDLVREPLRITLPSPFIVETSAGGLVTAGAGSDVFVPDTVETLLVTQGPDNALAWLQRQRAVWESVAALIAEKPSFGSVVPGFEELAPSLSNALVTVLPIDQVAGEFYVLARSSDLFAERLAPFADSGVDRPRVEILNGTRVPGLTGPLAETLIRSGFRVVKTDNSQFETQRTTLVIAQGVGGQQAALDAARELGVGEVVVETTGSSVVDVSIIVGRDLSDNAG